MRISSKGKYGLRALLDLTQHYGKDPVTSADIAARQQIPEAYLDHLLIMLRKRRLVRSVRGPQGGHELARAPGRITLADAVIALEVSFEIAGGFERTTRFIDRLRVPYVGPTFGGVECR